MIPEMPLKDLFNKENSGMKKNNTDVPISNNRRNEYLNKTQPNNTQKQSHEKEHVSFKRAYNEVSAVDNDNRKKTVSYDRELKTVQDYSAGPDKGIHENRVKSQNFLANESIKNVQYMNPDKAMQKDAIDIIMNSLLNISEILNLEIAHYPVFNEAETEGFSYDTIEQISEIIYSLKNLADLLDSAVKNSVSLEMKGISVNPEIAVKLSQDLRSEIFNLEMAFKMAGITEDVSRAVTEKMDKPFVYGNIPQAIDPQSLSMQESQLNQLLNNHKHGSQEKINAVISRIVALIKEEEPGISKNKLLMINGSKIGNNITAGNSTDHQSFNSQVLRRLLKIEGDADAVEGENSRDTGFGDKQKKIVLSNIFLSSKGAMNRNFQEIYTLAKESSDALSGMDTSIKIHGQQSVDFINKLPSLNSKSLEESVIAQVTQRFHSAIKNGIYEVRLILRPESLGDVRLTIQMEGDIVTARIQVENQQVKQIIENNLNNLKDSLEEQNLQAGSFDVNINRNSQDGEHGFDELAGKTSSSEENENDESNSPGDNQKHFGENTGRRFGSNSIEYFA
ncbi:MAG: flagellar hook-length control protein FliK [Chitinispirillia bacterium]|jgi:hypothetical protein